MKLPELSLKEHLELCRRAERLCAERFRALYRRLGPAEEALRLVLLDLAADEEAHARTADRWYAETDWPPVWHMNESGARALLERHFPSLFQGPPHEADRGQIVTFVASVEAECAGFYRALENLATDPAVRRYFRNAAEEEDEHAHFLAGVPT
jgi:rubrerythrin